MARYCKWKGCKTKLAKLNQNKYCFVHLMRGLDLEFEKSEKERLKNARLKRWKGGKNYAKAVEA